MNYLLNIKRDELWTVEKDHGVTVSILADRKLAGRYSVEPVKSQAEQKRPTEQKPKAEHGRRKKGREKAKPAEKTAETGAEAGEEAEADAEQAKVPEKEASQEKPDAAHEIGERPKSKRRSRYWRKGRGRRQNKEKPETVAQKGGSEPERIAGAEQAPPSTEE